MFLTMQLKRWLAWIDSSWEAEKIEVIMTYGQYFGFAGVGEGYHAHSRALEPVNRIASIKPVGTQATVHQSNRGNTVVHVWLYSPALIC